MGPRRWEQVCALSRTMLVFTHWVWGECRRSGGAKLGRAHRWGEEDGGEGWSEVQGDTCDVVEQNTWLDIE